MNINGMIVAQLNRKRESLQASLDGINKLIAEFGGGSGKTRAKRTRKPVTVSEGAVAGPSLSRSEKMKARWAERKAKAAAEATNTATQGADLAQAAGD